jgi:hypothetical protein
MKTRSSALLKLKLSLKGYIGLYHNKPKTDVCFLVAKSIAKESTREGTVIANLPITRTTFAKRQDTRRKTTRNAPTVTREEDGETET